MGYFVAVCGVAAAFLVGGVVWPECPDQTPKPDITFETLDTQCIGLDEINGGRVWLCDNGHVEYDETRVKFPELEKDDGPES